MLNQTVLVGRIVNEPEIEEFETEKVAYITVAISRSYKNAEGEYETDFVDCKLWNTVAQSTVDYCRKGDLIGIKGHLLTKICQGNTKTTEVIVDKISFLTNLNK